MKNLRKSALFLCALIACSPIQVNAFSLKSIADTVLGFGKKSTSYVSNLGNSFWKKIINNPIATATIIGGATFFVAAVIAAKRKRFSLRFKTEDNNPWELDFTGDRFPYAKWKYTQIPSEPGTPVELRSVGRPPSATHTPPPRPASNPSTSQDPNNSGIIITPIPRFIEDNVEASPSAIIPAPADSKNPLHALFSVNRAVPIPTRPSSAGSTFSEVSTWSNVSRGSMDTFDPAQFDDLLSSGSIRSNYSALSNNPHVDALDSPSRKSIRLSKNPKPSPLYPTASLQRNIGSIRKNGKLAVIPTIVVSSSNDDQSDQTPSKRRFSIRGFKGWAGTLRPKRNPKHLLPITGRSARSSLDIGRNKDSCIRIFNINSLKSLLLAHNTKALINVRLSPQLAEDPNIVTLLEDLQLAIFAQEIQPHQLQEIAKKAEVAQMQEMLNVYILVNQIKKMFDENNSNALFELKLSPGLKKYPNLQKLLIMIKTFIFENNQRLETLKSIALPGKTIELQDKLATIAETIQSCNAYDVNPAADSYLLAGLATLVKKPKILLRTLAVDNPERQPLTLIEELYNEYCRSDQNNIACLRRLSDVRRLLDRRTNTQKKNGLNNLLKKAKSPNPLTSEATSSNSNGKPVGTLTDTKHQ